ncbi:MAG: hypothetical protein ACP5M0_09840 [Desulfomonilaceae bacterium]
MKSKILQFLCKDCLAAALCAILVMIVIVSVTMTCTASQYWTKNSVTDYDTWRSTSQNEELLKKKNMEIEERIRDGEMPLVFGAK